MANFMQLFEKIGYFLFQYLVTLFHTHTLLTCKAVFLIDFGSLHEPFPVSFLFFSC